MEVNFCGSLPCYYAAFQCLFFYNMKCHLEMIIIKPLLMSASTSAGNKF